MFMRFRGGGIGHLGSTLDATCVFEKLNDALESNGASNEPGGEYQEELESGDGDSEEDEDEDIEDSEQEGEVNDDEMGEEELGPEDGEDDDTYVENYEGFAEY